MKVAIYCRLSEEDNNKQNKLEDSQSIQNQKSMLISFALEKGWEIYKIYSDDDYTGADRRRPEFNKLLKDAEQKKFDIILCKSQSRFTRELELVEKYIHGLFPLWGIRFVGYADNADTAIKGNKKARQINGLVNEWYLEDLSDNIKTVLTDRRKKGMHIGSFALYGYIKDPNQKGHLIIDPKAAEVVREVFQLYADGVGRTQIARILNERGIPNPTEYKRQKGINYKTPTSKISTLWKYYAISDMLSNEMYIGNMVQGKYGSVSYKSKNNKPIPKDKWIIVEGTHDAIIDRVLWDKVQAMITSRSKPMCSGELGLFAGKAKCMYCGYTLRSAKSREYRYLKCGSRHVSKDACKGAFIAQRFLEEEIIRNLNELISEYLDLNRAEESIKIKNDLLKKKNKIIDKINQDKIKIEEFNTALKNLYLDKSNKVISLQEYQLFSEEFNKDISVLSNNIEKRHLQIENMEEIGKKMKSRKEILNKYSHVEKLDRVMLDTLIDYIEVGRREARNATTPVVIHWKL